LLINEGFLFLNKTKHFAGINLDLKHANSNFTLVEILIMTHKNKIFSVNLSEIKFKTIRTILKNSTT
jgi:hypothetical protein